MLTSPIVARSNPPPPHYDQNSLANRFRDSLTAASGCPAGTQASHPRVGVVRSGLWVELPCASSFDGRGLVLQLSSNRDLAIPLEFLTHVGHDLSKLLG
jgi:hypothetical protein